jgi:hypothetical protein
MAWSWCLHATSAGASSRRCWEPPGWLSGGHNDAGRIGATQRVRNPEALAHFVCRRFYGQAAAHRCHCAGWRLRDWNFGPPPRPSGHWYGLARAVRQGTRICQQARPEGPGFLECPPIVSTDLNGLWFLADGNELCRHRRDGMGAMETASPCNGAGSDMGHSRL